MASKLSQRLLVGWSTLALAAGCSQVLGLSDYEIDPKLDGADGNEGGETNPPGGAGGGTDLLGGADAGGAGGQAPLPELVPCDSEDCCTDADGVAVGEELLGDVGFELGPVSNGDTPWTQESTNEIEAITDELDLGWKPKAGDFYVYLSGIAGETTSVYSENLSIPSDAGWFVLSGFRNFQIDVKDNVNGDFAGIGFYDLVETSPVELPFLWDRPSAGNDGWGETSGWTRFEATWDAAPHVGKQRYLGVRGSSDEYPESGETPDDPLPSSSYLFDEISLKIFRCYK